MNEESKKLTAESIAIAVQNRTCCFNEKDAIYLADDIEEYARSKHKQNPLIQPKKLADAFLKAGYRGVATELHAIAGLIWDYEENGLDPEQTAEKIADKLTDISIAINNA